MLTYENTRPGNKKSGFVFDKLIIKESQEEFFILPVDRRFEKFNAAAVFLLFIQHVIKNKLNNKATISNEWSLNKKIIPLYSTQLYK